MPIDNYFDKSNNSPIVIFQLDLLKDNIQWINIGSGVWMVNFNNSYPFVDATLLDGFTTQSFGDIASALVDSEYYINAVSLLQCSETIKSFYYSALNLYIHLIDNDEPILHNIRLGVAFGYAKNTITPVDSYTKYEGRLTALPNFTKSRDPLFFGKLAYPTGSGTLVNSDGFFDIFAEDNNLYGNQGRILLGYPELSITEYETMFTGIIDKVTISETDAVFTLKDKRALLTKKVTYSCTNINALDAIREILSINYGYNYTEAYYNTEAWDAATLLAPNITLNYTDEETIINIIEFICTSCFGFFDITNDGFFTFRFIDKDIAGSFAIYKEDIINTLKIEYSPVMPH